MSRGWRGRAFCLLALARRCRPAPGSLTPGVTEMHCHNRSRRADAPAGRGKPCPYTVAAKSAIDSLNSFNYFAHMNRREFLQQSAVLAASVSTLTKAVNWPIGCLNRPWTKWTYDQTLDSIKSAGYKLTGLLTRTRDDPFIAPDATPAYLEALKKKLAARGLIANMGALRSRHSIPLEESIRDVHVQIDNAHFLGLEYLLTFGVDDPSQQDHYFRVMSDAAQYSQTKGLKLVTKPHAGSSAPS